jgi:oligoendopeptidase F
MDYKGYNIATHEMGHNVEQVFSLYGVDHTLLSSVPNNAFTEGLAFVFQARNLELLGLPAPTAEERRLQAIQDLWNAYEIAGVALVDVQVWKWLYAHPEATPAELRAAVVSIAREAWNRWYAPIFGVRDVALLAIYSHMIEEPLYLADYPLGHVIAAQLEERFEKAGKVGPEFERMTTFGSLSPDLWMRNATGEPISPRALLDDAKKALDAGPR